MLTVRTRAATPWHMCTHMHLGMGLRCGHGHVHAADLGGAEEMEEARQSLTM